MSLALYLSLVSQFSHNWYFQLQNDYFFATKVKFFYKLVADFLFYVILSFWAVLHVFMNQFWAVFLLTTNLATTGWTRKWRQQRKKHQNEIKLIYRQLLKQWSEQTTQKLPNKGPQTVHNTYKIPHKLNGTENCEILKNSKEDVFSFLFF